MTAALFGPADIPPMVAPDLRGPWSLVVAVTGIDPLVVDVGHAPPNRRHTARAAWAGPTWGGRWEVKVRPHLTGDDLLGVLLHEAVHVMTGQQSGLEAFILDPPHGPLFRAGVAEVSERLGLPAPPSGHPYWPSGLALFLAATRVRAFTGGNRP